MGGITGGIMGGITGGITEGKTFDIYLVGTGGFIGRCFLGIMGGVGINCGSIFSGGFWMTLSNKLIDRLFLIIGGVIFGNITVSCNLYFCMIFCQSGILLGIIHGSLNIDFIL